MKESDNRTHSDHERVEEWDETVVVWNATVAKIPPAAVQPKSTEDAGSVAGGKTTPDRGAGRGQR